MVVYNEAFRDSMVRKMAGPQALSASELARQFGVHQSTLSRWLREAGRVASMSQSKTTGKQRRPQDWPAEEKLAVVLEAASLEGEALGGFLRERGVHQATLDRWREQMLQGLTPSKPSRKKSPEARQVKELERELRRKEKALAEASALLLLKKKAEAIWGDGDDDTGSRSGK